MPTLKAIHICNSHQPTLKPKIAKEYVLPTHTSELTLKPRKTKQDVESQLTTMYKNNRRNSNKFMAFGSYQTLCLTESFVLRNRLLFIY
jgi:polysaccharide deacetylase 2 family uncharacterized protein YibQ